MRLKPQSSLSRPLLAAEGFLRRTGILTYVRAKRRALFGRPRIFHLSELLNIETVRSPNPGKVSIVVPVFNNIEDVTDLTIFDTLMRVNYLGSVWCTAHALPHLKRSKGRLVAISSLTGLTGVPKRTAYAATKHAMAGFFDSLRIELDGTGVTVTMIYPGFVFSEINQRALSPDGTPFGDRGYTRRKGETMETDQCGRLILAAVANRNRDLVMTWRGKIGRMLKLMSPALVDRIAKGVIESRQ